jgi:hypothetical protein
VTIEQRHVEQAILSSFYGNALAHCVAARDEEAKLDFVVQALRGGEPSEWRLPAS